MRHQGPYRDTLDRDRSEREMSRRSNRRSAFFRDDGERRERDARYGPDAHRDGLPRDETERLIASDKVEGTPVIGPEGERLGSIHNFMVDKRSGEVVYAVLKSSGGFLGLEQRYYPVDWDELTFDTRADGYGVDFTREDLKRRRSFDSRGREWRRDDDDEDEGYPRRRYGAGDRFERQGW